MINPAERQKALAPLMNAIVNDAIPKDKIYGFDGEAGLGKTTAMIDALFFMIARNPNSRVLIATPFVKDNSNGSHISELINRRFGYAVAYAVDSKNIKSAGNMITNAQILVITHERLKRLLKDDKQRKLYFQGRDQVIIDEMPQFMEIFKITESALQDLELIIPKSVLTELQLVVGPIRDALSHSNYEKYAFKLVPHPEMDTLIAQIIKVVKSSYKEYIAPLNVKKRLKIKEGKLISQIYGLKELYNKTVIASSDKFGNNGITTYDSSIDYKKLGKAIILSADLAVHNSDQWNLFERAKVERVADFSKWLMHFCSELTGTTTSMERYANFCKETCDLILRNIAFGDKVIIAGNKEQITKMENLLRKQIPLGVVVEYLDFYNMVGTNDYSDFNKLFVLSIPIKPAYSYVHAYQYYENESLVRRIRPNWMKVNASLHVQYRGNGQSRKFLSPNVTPSLYQNFSMGINHCSHLSSIHRYVVFDIRLDLFDRVENIEVGMQKKGKRLSMIAPEIEAYKRADQFALLYQLIMRIDRQKSLNTEVFMLFSSDCFKEDFEKYMKNVTMVDDITLNLIRSKQYNNLKRTEQSLASRFIEHLDNLPPGEFKKSDIRKSLNINDPSLFSRMLKSDPFKEYNDRHNIRFTKYKIIIGK